MTEYTDLRYSSRFTKLRSILLILSSLRRIFLHIWRSGGLLRRRIKRILEFGLKEDSIKNKQAKLKTVSNIWCSHTVLMPIQAFCNVTEFRLVTSWRRFGEARCLHLDCQAVKQRYMIQSTLGFVSKPALLGIHANSCAEYESVCKLRILNMLLLSLLDRASSW